jgi:hypothetical protein
MDVSGQFHALGLFIPWDRAPVTHSIEELSPELELRLVFYAACGLVTMVTELSILFWFILQCHI